MSNELTKYAKEFMGRPYETIYGAKNNKDGKTITIFSVWDVSHPDCPIILIDKPKNAHEKMD